LASKAYDGELNIEVAIINILSKMPQHIHSQKPRVPNPVKPEEDFACSYNEEELIIRFALLYKISKTCS